MRCLFLTEPLNNCRVKLIISDFKIINNYHAPKCPIFNLLCKSTNVLKIVLFIQVNILNGI